VLVTTPGEGIGKCRPHSANAMRELGINYPRERRLSVWPLFAQYCSVCDELRRQIKGLGAQPPQFSVTKCTLRQACLCGFLTAFKRTNPFG
jgi:hypothetical protein